MADHVDALRSHLYDHGDPVNGDAIEGLLQLRMRTLILLNQLRDSTGRAIQIGESLIADCERLLGPSHTDTVAVRNNLGFAYRVGADCPRQSDFSRVA